MLRHYLGWRRVAFLVAALSAATFLLAQDAQPVQANHTTIFVTPSGRTAPEPILMYVNGPAARATVRVANVHDPTGVSGFEVDVEFRSDLMSVLFMTAHTTWLTSTGRTNLACTAPEVTPVAGSNPPLSRANVSCITLGGAPPYGPTGSALLATIYFTPGSQPSNTVLTLTTRTKVVNTPLNLEPAAIPATRVSGNAVIARCANFNDDNGDGVIADGSGQSIDLSGDVVSVIDIVGVVNVFGWTPSPSQPTVPQDVNFDGAVSVSDIIIAVQQFGTRCL